MNRTNFKKEMLPKCNYFYAGILIVSDLGIHVDGFIALVAHTIVV